MFGCALRRLVNEYKLPFPVTKFQMLALCASYLGGEGRYQAVVDTLSVEVPPALLSAVEYKQQEVPPNAEPYAKECAELYVHAKRGATQWCSCHVWRAAHGVSSAELAELDHVPDEVCSGEVVLTASLLPTSSHNPGVSFVSGRTVVVRGSAASETHPSVGDPACVNMATGPSLRAGRRWLVHRAQRGCHVGRSQPLLAATDRATHQPILSWLSGMPVTRKTIV